MNRLLIIMATLMGFSINNLSLATEKIFINSNNVLVGNNGIFIKIDDDIFQTSSLHSDEYGTYIFDYDMRKCQDCGRDYPGYEKECPYSEMHDNNNDKNENRN